MTTAGRRAGVDAECIGAAGLVLSDVGRSAGAADLTVAAAVHTT